MIPLEGLILTVVVRQLVNYQLIHLEKVSAEIKNTKNQNEWKKLMEFSLLSASTSCYDPISKQLYIACDEEMLIFNMQTQKKKLRRYSINKIQYKTAICIDSIPHLIGGYSDNGNLHQIWNDESKKLEQIHRFNEYPMGFSKFGLIYISKRKELLLLSG